MNRKKILISIISFVFVLVVLSPITQNWKQKPKDDFPLSYYPMFSFKRDNYLYIAYLKGIDEEGKHYKVPYDYVIKGAGFNRSRKQISKTLINNKAMELCKQTLRNLNTVDKEPYNKITEVIVLSGQVHIDKYMKGIKRFRYRNRIYASCSAN